MGGQYFQSFKSNLQRVFKMEMTVRDLKKMLNGLPDETKIFFNGRTEFLDEDFNLKYTNVKLYSNGYYGLDNNDGKGEPFKALVFEI